jgi:sugar lactone lactonase YvrE
LSILVLFRNYIAFFITGSIVLFTGCSKPGQNKPSDSLNADRTLLLEPALGQTDSIIITSDVVWRLTIPAAANSWIYSDKDTGVAGRTVVYLTIQTNMAHTNRIAILTLSSPVSGISPVSITVNQDHDVKITFFTPHAPGGAIINIFGRGFSPVVSENQVTINGSSAVVQTAVNNALTVIVPARAGTGRIRVTVNSITDVSSGDFFYDWIGVVSLLAGNTQGYADGTGTAAKFSHPAGLGLDAAGNIYVADYANFKVRKVTPAGVVTTLPGRIPAYPGGPNTDYGLPNDVAVDASGNIFVAEVNSNVISRITPGGVVSVFAGGGPSGYADGTGIAALFHRPSGITIDPFDIIYVADLNNHRIRKITTAGVVTTLAGSTQGYAEGTGTAAFFNVPYGLTMDAQGILYVSDNYNNRIRRLTAAGVVTTFAGNGRSGSADGPGTIAEIQPVLFL